MVNEAEETFGHVSILVNNAAININNRVEDVSEEEYRKIIDVNQVGTFLGMKAVLPSMKKVKNGSIINISSIQGLRGLGIGIAYDASKYAVRGMSKSAALDFAEYGIRVNSVHPGFVHTQIIDDADPKLVESMVSNIPLKRMASLEEASSLVTFLASDESSYSTGAEFLMDGGLITTIPGTM